MTTGICAVCGRTVNIRPANDYGHSGEIAGHFTENSYDRCEGSNKFPRSPAGSRPGQMIAVFAIAGIAAITSPAWVPMIAGIIYRALR